MECEFGRKIFFLYIFYGGASLTRNNIKKGCIWLSALFEEDSTRHQRQTTVVQTILVLNS